MKKQTILFSTILIIMLLASCSGLPALSSQATPEPAVTTTLKDNTVSASGEVFPEKWATLAMPASGIIAEVLVSDGDTVAAGQSLVRLKGQEDVQARIASAQFALVDAQKNLNTLKKNAATQASVAHKEMADAQKAVEDAQKKVDNLKYPRTSDTVIDNTQSKIDLAKQELARTSERYRAVEDKPDGDEDKAEALLAMTNAQINLNNLIAKLNWYTGRATPTEAEQYRANLELAKSQLADAQREYEIYNNGPDPEELKVVEAQITNAEAELTAAQDDLASLELRAPFAGVISEPRINPGEYITFGQPAMLLADLSTLRVRTIDLNETDVARLQIGDSASVTFDGLPGVSVAGKVASIASKASEGSGVNFTVVIDLDEIPAGLRWGMTAFVVIKTTK